MEDVNDDPDSITDYANFNSGSWQTRVVRLLDGEGVAFLEEKLGESFALEGYLSALLLIQPPVSSEMAELYLSQYEDNISQL